MIREGKAADTMRILDLIEEAMQRSIYAGRGNLDRDFTRKLFARSVMSMGHTHHGGTFFVVVEEKGQVEGYFLGFLDRVYQVGDKLAATDVHYYISPRANPRDGIGIVNAFNAWADSNDQVIEAVIGQTNLFGEPDERLSSLLERKGFDRAGTIFKRSIQR